MKSELLLCGFCHRQVDKPCLSKVSSDTCTRTINKARAGGAGPKTITFDTPALVSFHTCMDQVMRERLEATRKGGDPLSKFTPKQAVKLVHLEAERRFIEWQVATRKGGGRPWYEVLKIPLTGSKHEIKIRRRFRDPAKAIRYANLKIEQAEGSASYQVQTRQGVVPKKPLKGLFGFDPQEALRRGPEVNSTKENVMAKAKAKKAKTNGAAKPGVKKDKAYYLRCAAGKEECGSGDFIRGHVLQGKLTAQEIADLAKKKFKGTTKPSDVYWNRGQLKAQKIAVPDMAKDAGK